jgi:hypothetical protein
MNRGRSYIAVLVIIMSTFSCKNMDSKDHGPIVLGDSSTIVTEKDPQKLQDLLVDLHPNIPESKDTAAPVEQKAPEQKPADTEKKTVAAVPPKQQQPAPEVAGLKAEFKDVSVLIPSLNAKQAGRQNLQNANGAVYTWVSGNINGNLLKVMGNVTKVSMRYQSVVVLKNDMGVLPLETFSTTTSWETMKGMSNVYKITGLDEKSLDHPDANRATIQNAVRKAAQRHRFARRRVQEWVNSAHNARSLDQKPFTTLLRSVMWKIDGKDANGRIFSKQIRIDIPM